MVVSFRLSRRGRRIHPLPPPPLPPSASAHAADDSRPPAAASLDVPVPPPPPHPPCEAAVSRLDVRIGARSELPDRNETVPVESDLEPSFALNLFPDGYSVGEPGKGMLSYLIGDDPKKRPYSKASRALISDIEHGCFPQDILHGIPCKFQNGSIVCEVRDYRAVFSNGDDYSGDDFPRVNRVHLRLGTECVVKDLSSIADASWTYHDQLTAECIILNALQPRLNLDPTPCLEMLCNSSAKKIDLGLNKRRQHNKDTSVLIMCTNPPENCKTKEFENASLEGIPSGLLNSLSVNCPSAIYGNNARSAAKSDTNNTIQSSSTLSNSSASCDGMQCASDTDHLFQNNEQRAQVQILQVGRITGQTQRVKVLPRKTKKLSNLLHEKHELKKCSPPNKNGRSTSQNSKGHHKSKCSPNKTELDLGSQKRLKVEAKVGQKIGNEDMEVQKQVPLSMPPRDPCTSLNTANPGIERVPEMVKSLHIWSKERHAALIVDRNNSYTVNVNDSGTPFIASFSGCSRKAACEPLEDMAVTKSQGTASKRKASKISVTSLNQEIKLKGERQHNVDAHMSTPCKNRSFEEPAVAKGRQQIEDTSLIHISANAPESCKPFNVCKAVAVCGENAALEGMPSAIFNSSLLNNTSSIHVNKVKSIVESDPGSTTPSSTLTNSSALCDRKHAPTPDHLLQSNEERAKVTVSQVVYKNRETQRVTAVPQNRKKSLKLLNERRGSKSHNPNRSAKLSPENSKGQKSTGSSNKEGFHLASGPQVEIKVGQIIGNKDMKVQEKVPLSVHSSCHPCTSLDTSSQCVEKMPEKGKSLHIVLNERHEAPVVDLKNTDMADPKGSRRPPATSFSANSRKAACEPDEDEAATEPQHTALNRKVTGISTISMNQEINLNGERQQKFDVDIEPHCENRSLEEPAIAGAVNSEPDIEKILSEVILTTQRHGLNEKASKSDVLESSWLLPPCEFFQPENVKEIPSTRDETVTHNVYSGTTSAWKIRRLTFHPSQYSSCLADESQYTLCLVETEALDDQITVGAIYGDEQIHIATLPTSCYAEKFVDQFISLMKRDGYKLCNDEVCNESCELRQQSEDVSHLGYPNGENAEYLMLSPSAVNSLPISTDDKVGCTFQNKLTDFRATLLQPLSQQLVLTEQQLTVETPEAFFLNPSHLPGGQQYTGQHPPDQGSSFACNPFATDPHQFPSIQPSQEVSVDPYLQYRDDLLGFNDIYSARRYSQLHQENLMDQYLQYRHDVSGLVDTYGMRMTASRYSQWRQEVPMDGYLRYRHGIPWFSDAYSASMGASRYGQWRQVYTQMGNVVYQWDLPDFGRQIHNSLPLRNGWNIPLSELQPIRCPQMSSRNMDFDGSVTSTPVQVPMPLDYQFPSQRMW